MLGSLGDAFVYIKYWAFIWGNILKFVGKLFFKRGPVCVIRELRQYPWILQTHRATQLLRRITKGRKGAYLESTVLVIHVIAVLLVEKLDEIFYQPERLLVNEDLVPPEIAMAMGLNVWLTESMGILLPFLNPEACLDFIDEAENAGNDDQRIVSDHHAGPHGPPHPGTGRELPGRHFPLL